MRSARPRSPVPSAASAPPTPSSVTVTVAHSFERRTLTVTWEARAYLVTLVMASAIDVVRRGLDRVGRPLVGQLGAILTGTAARLVSALQRQNRDRGR